MSKRNRSNRSRRPPRSRRPAPPPRRDPADPALRQADAGRPDLALVPLAGSDPPIDEVDRLAPLLGLIGSGALDDRLDALTVAIANRRRALYQARSVQALGEVRPGDRVRIAESIRPLYLQRAEGVVVGWSGQRVVVHLDVPAGRLRLQQVTVPPLALQRLRAG